MKNSIIAKTLLILASVIVLLFIIVGYLFIDSDNKLIEKIRSNNLKTTLDTFDISEREQLRSSKNKILLTTNNLAQNASIFVYNYDKPGLGNSLLITMKDDSIKAIKIWDGAAKELFLLAFKKNNKIELVEFIDSNFDKNFNHYMQYSELMYGNDSNNNKEIGKVTLYYDNTAIKEKIIALKLRTKKELEEFNLSIDKEKFKADIIKACLAIGLLFIILLSISYLMIKFVKNPLIVFKNGLDSFFNYLADSTKKVTKIGINTTDEFGQMGKSVNRSIEISMKMHQEINDLNTNLEVKIEERTQALKKSNENIKDSIKYASMIQQAILPQGKLLEDYFQDSFIFWQPKDIVGGDVYFIDILKNKDEVVIMVIDGAGHGVPGSFVTMLVKAIQTQIISDIEHNNLKPSPALMLAEFNQSIKTMLNQEKGKASEGNKSNAGFDGGILYYNKTTNECKYAGAKTPLYIINDNQLEIIKSDRKNVGYVRTKIDQQYTEYNIEIKEGTKLYITTDGLIDQEGVDDSVYGTNRFTQLILENSRDPFFKQKEVLTTDFKNFTWSVQDRKNIEQRDDITVIGIRF